MILKIVTPELEVLPTTVGPSDATDTGWRDHGFAASYCIGERSQTRTSW